jgi:hypothetical protein
MVVIESRVLLTVLAAIALFGLWVVAPEPPPTLKVENEHGSPKTSETHRLLVMLEAMEMASIESSYSEGSKSP